MPGSGPKKPSPRLPEKVRIQAGAEDAGRRLDQVLASHVPDLSRRRARVLIDIGGVFVDKKRVKVASRKVRAGQIIEAQLGGALERATKAVGRAARARDDARLPDYEIVYEDADIVVAHKPAGLLTAPTPESDRNNLAQLLEDRLNVRIYVVHRLDLGTSGLLVFAKTAEANKILSEGFRVHDYERIYLGVVEGVLAEPVTVDAPIAGKPAVTHLEPLERMGDRATVIRARLETGRTHQIRIHCAGIGHPIVGDGRYGSAGDPGHPALHALELRLRHPVTGEAIQFTRAWPPEMEAWLARMRESAILEPP